MQDILIRSYDPQNTDEIAAMARIWNKVVEDGVAFPQEDFLDTEGASAFFAAQTDCGVAVDTQTGSICGLYILHPEQCRPLRPHCKCELCRIDRASRQAHRRKVSA